VFSFPLYAPLLFISLSFLKLNSQLVPRLPYIRHRMYLHILYYNVPTAVVTSALGRMIYVRWYPIVCGSKVRGSSLLAGASGAEI
jgi:hypothetical protein